MMNNSSKASHRPDSLIGAIAVFEGIQEACTLLNGPIGCKTYPAYMSSILASHPKPVDINYFADFYFGQTRIPCTYIDETDFIYGSESKVTQALKQLEQSKPGIIGVINHSGTSLIGDDLTRIIQNTNINPITVAIDSTGFTGTYASGFQDAVIKILDGIINRNNQKISRTVNIIGSTLFHYNWENDIAEIKRILKLLGIQTVSVICAGESIANIQKASQAELNLVLNEEYGDRIVSYLETVHGIPNINLGLQAPYGLSASEAWFKAVADFFDTSSESITNESSRVRKKCYPALAHAFSFTSSLRGMPFAIFGDSSQVYALTTFLYEYLGMLPVVVGIKEVGTKNFESIKKYLSANMLDTSVLVNPDQYELLDCFNKTTPKLLLGSSIEKNVSLRLSNPPQFIPITFPYYERVTLTNRPLMGFNGVLTIIEDILNMVKYVR
ncbi:nitrogenase component 1 [Candidatus Bathycorpusculum sp.]|uniref:nitrogenase component 1 n=1 Tax=Candidatus Bathycorpusculum sp. TaxID=2994959 RepID=UPI00282A5CEF|nr:nitrogenase component 1 [Candidatus Termitimicrobium sp.]